MNYRNTEMVDRLAAEYALGTLQGAARRRFKALRSQFEHIDDAANYWEGVLASLAMKLPPVAPPDSVWSQVQTKLRTAEESPTRSGVSPWLAAVASFVFAVMLMLTVNYPAEEETPLVVAIVQNQQEQALWRIHVTDVINVKHVSAEPLQDNQDYQLWFKVADGVVSLGLLPQSGDKVFQIKEAIQPLIKMGGTIGVSIEPAGGSPLITKPSGPVIAHAQLVAG